jgi:hypothetical protein
MSRVRHALACLVLAASVTLPAPASAQCPASLGDLSPGTLDATTVPPTWRAVGDGVIDVSDVVALLRHAARLHDAQWAAPGPFCTAAPGDVSPGTRVGATTPPLWTPLPDGTRDVGDVIVLLRLTVELDRLDETLTYWRDAKVLIDAKCGTCHFAGGVGPFPLTTYAEVFPSVAAAAGEITAGHMPPWPPDPACNDYLHSRALSEAQKATLLAWIAVGAPEGDPATEPPPILPPPPITYDVHMPMAEAYTPDGTVSDDYRCFVLDWPVATSSYVTGFSVSPDQGALVHHVIAYAIDPPGVAGVRSNDANEPGPGYTCYGGPGANSARWVGAWVPGAEGGAFPPGTGIRVAPGSVMVMQVHYNMDATRPVPDRSVLDFRTAPSVVRPAAVMLMADQGFSIPAGDPDYTAQEVAPASLVVAVNSARAEIGGAAGDPVVVHGVGLHMHQLGKWTDLSIVRAGSPTCLLDIPDWDFHWQGAYDFVAPVRVAMNDQVSIRCNWDNSPANQAFVGGVQQDPVVVTWGEGSRDEMCLAIMYATAP